MRIAQEEIFGPVVSVIPIGRFDEAIEVANGVPYGLSASIYTRDVNRAFQAMRDLYTGIVYVNAPTIGAETHLPFGGTKQTGNGHREAAIAAIDFYTEWKTIYIDYSATSCNARRSTTTRRDSRPIRVRRALLAQLVRASSIGSVRLFVWFVRDVTTANC